MSDRICLLNDGGIEQIGTPHDLYFEPATIFAAGFIGESCIIDVKVDEDRRVFLPDGAELKSRGKRPDGRGAARLIVRPESLRVLAQEETADNELVAHVALVVLSGAMTRVHASLACGTQVAAALPSRFGGTRFAAGDASKTGCVKASATVLDGSR